MPQDPKTEDERLDHILDYGPYDTPKRLARKVVDSGDGSYVIELPAQLLRQEYQVDTNLMSIDLVSDTEPLRLHQILSAGIAPGVGDTIIDRVRQRLERRHGVTTNTAADRLAYTVLAYVAGLIDVEISDEGRITARPRRDP